jgi:integrase
MPLTRANVITYHHYVASVHRHPNSPYFSAFFYLPDGRRTSRSTGSSNRREAQRIADKFEDAAKEAKVGRLTETRARKAIADIFALANRQDLPSFSIRDYFERWLKVKDLEAGERTAERYRSAIKQFIQVLGAKALRDLLHLNASEITAARDAISEKLSPNTANFTLKVVRAALGAAVKENILDFNEAKRVELLARKGKQKNRRQPFTQDQIELLMKIADSEWRGMIIVGLYTGLRLGDVAVLDWRNIDLEQGILSLQDEKTGRNLVQPLAPSLVDFLVKLSPSQREGPVFARTNRIRQRHKHGGALSNQFYDLLVRAGLAEKRDHKANCKGRDSARKFNPLSFHSLRHTATSWLKNAGVSDAIARDIIGHESEAVSANYTHIDLDTKRKAIGLLPSVNC